MQKVEEIEVTEKKKRHLKAFFEGFLTNALNPKVSMFYLAAFPQFISESTGSIGISFALVSVHALLNLIWFSAMVILFSKLVKTAASVSFQKWLKVITGVVFIGFGVKLASIKP